MTEKPDKMNRDRTGGGRGNAGVNPPVAHFSTPFPLPTDSPLPFRMEDLRAHARAKGFPDGDSDQAEYFLNRISYQHASGYYKLFQNDDGTLAEDASLMRVHRAILFDRKMQALLMEYIGLFELQFRAQYSYRLAEERGAFAHRNPSNFKKREFFDKFIEKYENEFNRQMKNRNAEVVSAYARYGDAPTWLAVEIMSFGTLSMLYSNTRSRNVREGVSSSFGATPEEFQSWSRSISAVRNQCAHFGQLCGRKLVSRPKMIPGVKADNGDPFYIALILMKLLRSDRFFSDDGTLAYSPMMLKSLTDLIIEFRDIAGRCGIPANWKELASNRNVMGFDVSFTADAPGGKSYVEAVLKNGSRKRLC